jgi:hypothetical protein
LGPAINPSSDMDMYRTVADTAPPFRVCELRGAGMGAYILPSGDLRKERPLFPE